MPDACQYKSLFIKPVYLFKIQKHENNIPITYPCSSFLFIEP